MDHFADENLAFERWFLHPLRLTPVVGGCRFSMRLKDLSFRHLYEDYSRTNFRLSTWHAFEGWNEDILFPPSAYSEGMHEQGPDHDDYFSERDWHVSAVLAANTPDDLLFVPLCLLLLFALALLTICRLAWLYVPSSGSNLVAYRQSLVQRLTLNGHFPAWLWMLVGFVVLYSFSRNVSQHDSFSTNAIDGFHCNSNSNDFLHLLCSLYSLVLWTVVVTNPSLSLLPSLPSSSNSSSASSPPPLRSRWNVLSSMSLADLCFTFSHAFLVFFGYFVAFGQFSTSLLNSSVFPPLMIIKAMVYTGLDYSLFDDFPWVFVPFLAFFTLFSSRPSVRQSLSFQVSRLNLFLFSYFLFRDALIGVGFLHYEGNGALLFIYFACAEYAYFFLQ